MKRHYTFKVPCLLFVTLLYAANVQGQLTLNQPNTTGTYTNHISILLAPGFSSTGPFHAFIQAPPLELNPSADQNYIVTTTYLKPFTTEPASPTVMQAMSGITYVDGLGRSSQNITVKGSPDYGDVVAPIAYDAFGREAFKYLPYATSTGMGGAFKTNALLQQEAYYRDTPPKGQVATQSAYAQTVFDLSPLNRMQEQGFPGDVWQPAAVRDATQGHTVVTVYALNNTVAFTALADTRCVARYSVTLDTSWAPTLTLETNAVYEAGELQVVISKDENWIPATGADNRLGTVEEYTDKQGHIVLRRTFNKVGSTVQMLSTYYVYDDFGNLSYVLTPGSTPDRTSLPSGTTLVDWLARYVYQYRYDERNRLVEKQLPSKGREYTVYNANDEVLATQDANQRTKNEWTITKYDPLGRVALTGIWNNNNTGISRASLQSLINGWSATNLRESRTTTGTGYSNVAWPTANITTTLSLHYYDDYTVPGLSATPYTSSGSALTKGLPTVTRIKILNQGTGTANMLWDVSYYDDKGQVTKRFSQHYKGGGTANVYNYDATESSYSFSGQVEQVIRRHYTANAADTAADIQLTVKTEYTYDHQNRLVDTWKTVNTGTRILVARNEYNEVDQLVKKEMHSTNNGNSFAQSVAYTYNERGWLRTATAPLFTQELIYNTGTTKYYNGNIAQQSFNRKYTTSSTTTGTYSYTYDKLNRLLSGTLAGDKGKEELSYDLLGNIASLKRTGTDSTYVDNLSYAYNTKGQLQTVTDASADTLKAFQPSGATAYTYDANGNLLTRVKSGASSNITATTYNYLNLPQSIMAGGVNINYTYDATGRKLRSTNGINGQIRDYVGGIEYSDGNIELVQMEEGRLLHNGSGGYSYEYMLKDHLGNIRSGFASMAPTTPTFGSDYYPFGLQYQADMVAYNPKNNYLYNGKELQDGLKQYDYGARFYDPVIGRWGSVDPLAEKYFGMTIYGYGVNNPIRFIDPNGMETSDPNAIAALLMWARMKASMKEAEDKGQPVYAGGYDNKLDEVTITDRKMTDSDRYWARLNRGLAGDDLFRYPNGNWDYGAQYWFERSRTPNPYMPWMGPDAIGVQGSFTVNTIFAEINVSGGIAFDNYQIGVYGDISGSVGVDLTRLRPGIGGGIGVSFFNKNDENFPTSLEDAINGSAHSRTLIFPGVFFGIAKPLGYGREKELIHVKGYNQYTVGFGEGLGYSEGLSQSVGKVFTIHNRR